MFTRDEQAIGVAIFTVGFILFIYCMDRLCTKMNKRNNR